MHTHFVRLTVADRTAVRLESERENEYQMVQALMFSTEKKEMM